MPLVPGKLPAGTCYGTPQQLLDIFSQYLSVTGTDQGVLYTTNTNSPPLVTDVTEPTPRLWVDRSASNSPVVYSYGGSTSKNWVMLGSQTIAKTFLYTSFNSPTLGASKHALICNLPARSLINWVAYRVNSAFTGSWTVLGLQLDLDPVTLNTASSALVTGNPGSGALGSGALPNIPITSAASTNAGPTILQSSGILGKWTPVVSSNIYDASRLYVYRPATPATYTGGSISFWVNYTQLQA